MKYQRATLPELVLGALADYPLTRVDVGDEATMKKNGFQDRKSTRLNSSHHA